MFLHIGGDAVIPVAEIIAVIKLAKNQSPLNSEFLKTAEEEGFVIQLEKKPISAVITAEKVYLSPISVQTLHKRVRQKYPQRKLSVKES
ncbi:MAG TPA: DUF370 domain-containing protein [Firmicutes bacterium]|nr:DUF370 domain-containing protein [Bacillota bacterium]